METTRDRELETRPDTEGRCELIEMHLFDADAREEKALCGADVSVLDLTIVQDYLERRMHNLPLPTVCNRCKFSAIPFAGMRRSALAAEGMSDEAEAHRGLADTLSRETDPGLSGDWYKRRGAGQNNHRGPDQSALIFTGHVTRAAAL